MDALTDNALMLKVKENDLDKLGLLFERYKRPLYGFFYHLNRQQELSEDLVQNTFLRVLKYRHLFRGDGEFKTWLFHIARNVSHDHYRKEKIKFKVDVADWENKLAHDEHRVSAWEQQDQRDLLARALEALPSEKREVLVLSRYHEKKYKEIGEILGCEEGAVKVKVFRALQELRAIYQQLERTL